MSYLPFFAKDFSPLDIAGGKNDLVLWLDAAYNGSIINTSGSVSRWIDKSGNGNDAVQGTGSKQPTTGASTQNGKNVIDFDGNDSLILPSALYSIPNGNNTTFIVIKTNANNSTQRIINMSESFSSRYNLQYDSTVGQISFQSRNAAGSAVSKTGITETNFNIIQARREGTTQALTYNNEAEATNSNGADENGVDAATIGAFTDGTTQPLDGSIAEVLIYNRSLNDIEICLLQRYLSFKWGITLPFTFNFWIDESGNNIVTSSGNKITFRKRT